MIYYKIRDWDKHFENNKTRILKRLLWVPFPNQHDGDGYTELLNHKDGAAHFGAWCAICQVASKCQPRGSLLRSGEKAHDPESLSRMTRIPEKILKLAMERFVSIGWLESYDNPALECRTGAVLEAKFPVAEGKGMEGKEGKGMEGNTLSEGDRLISETLAAIITKSKNINITGQKITAWTKDISRLRQRDNISTDRISLALDWYKDHIDEQYTPVIECGSSLREKFIKLEGAMQRSLGGMKQAEAPKVHSIFDGKD